MTKKGGGTAERGECEREPFPRSWLVLGVEARKDLGKSRKTNQRGQCRCRSRGSRRSRSQSPIRFPVSEMISNANPGSQIGHQATIMTSRPSVIMRPHDAVPAGTPTPRKLSAASTWITMATSSVMMITIVLTTFGEEMLAHDPPAVRAERTRRGGEITLAQRKHFGAHKSGVARPRPDQQDDDHVAQAGSKDAAQEQSEKNAGQCELHIHDAHQDLAGRAAEPARRHADERAEGGRPRHDDADNNQRNPRAVHQPAEDVAAGVVGAQRMVPGAAIENRRRQPRGEVDEARIMRRKKRRQSAPASTKDHGNRERDGESEPTPPAHRSARLRKTPDPANQRSEQPSQTSPRGFGGQ